MVNEPEPETEPQQQQDLSSGIHGNSSQTQAQPSNPNIASPTPTTTQPIQPQPQQLLRANQSQDQLHQLQNRLQLRVQQNPSQNLIAPTNTVSHGVTPTATSNPQPQLIQLQARLRRLQQRLQQNPQQSLIAPSNGVSQGLPAITPTTVTSNPQQVQQSQARLQQLHQQSQAHWQQLQQQSQAQLQALQQQTQAMLQALQQQSQARQHQYQQQSQAQQHQYQQQSQARQHQYQQQYQQQLQSLVPLNPQQNLPSNTVSQGVLPFLYLPTATSNPQQVHQSQAMLQQQSQAQSQQLQQQRQARTQQLQQQLQAQFQQLQQPLQLQSLLSLNPQQNLPSNPVSQGQRPIMYHVPTATSNSQQEEMLLDGMLSIPKSALPPPIVPTTAAPPALPNWEVSSLAAVRALTPFIREPVNPQSAEHTVLLDLFPSHQFRVNKIERVVNNGLWRKFQSHRKYLLTSKSADFELLSELGLTDAELQQQAYAFLNVNLPVGIPDYADNIALLFHGTRGNIEDVLRQGLDERLAGGGLCGRGIYFSDDPAKAAGYAAHGVLFLCAVMLGDCASTPVSHYAVREPEKGPSQRRNHEDNFFDSVVSRPLSVNEFVIYNRYQCVPLYEIHYTKLFDAILPPEELSANGLMYKLAREKLPPFAWTRVRKENRILRPDEANRWPFFAQSLISRMENFESESPPSAPEAKKKRIEIEGMVANERCQTPWNLPANHVCAGHYSTSTPGPSSTKEKRASTVLDANSSAIQPAEQVKEADASNGECPICCSPMTPATSATLDCCAQNMCKDCYSKLEVTRQSMSKQTFTFLKCPYCGECTGTQIGTCPDGEMRTQFLPEDLLGYEGAGTIMISYYVNHGRYTANRVAYLPSTPEGRRILMLLSIAWDRRHVFTIGDSLTRAQSDVLIWNIHHKTAKMGAVSAYGYPDSTYLTRVADELKQYGIQ